MIHRKVFSTGILRRGANTITAVAAVLNSSIKNPVFVKIEVLNWSNYDTSTQIPVKIGETLAVWPFKIAPNQIAEFYTDLVENEALLYEIRIETYD